MQKVIINTFFNNSKKGIFAFSLIELMISLITISCITAAFTPVVTKKLKNGSTSVAMSEITTNCQSKFGAECTFCYAQKCVACAKYCNDNQYKNNDKCACENCTDRASNCIRCDSKYCLRCKEGYGYDSSTHSCTLCSAGSTSDGTKPCEKCPTGQYQANSGKSSCTLASLGYYVSTEGATAQTPCPAGQYQNESGASSCKPCAGGAYSLGSAINCLTCSSRITNCSTCTNTTGTCTSCSNNTALSGGNCLACSNVWSNCTSCNSSSCTACKTNYTLKNGSCELSCVPYIKVRTSAHCWRNDCGWNDIDCYCDKYNCDGTLTSKDNTGIVGADHTSYVNCVLNGDGYKKAPVVCAISNQNTANSICIKACQENNPTYTKVQS